MRIGDLVIGRGLYAGLGIVVEIDVGPTRAARVVYDDPGLFGAIGALHPPHDAARPSAPRRVEMTDAIRATVRTVVAQETLRRIG